MTADPLYSGKRAADRLHGGVLWLIAVGQMADQQSAEQGILTTQAAANSPPDAGDVCVVTTAGAAIAFQP